MSVTEHKKNHEVLGEKFADDTELFTVVKVKL